MLETSAATTVSVSSVTAPITQIRISRPSSRTAVASRTSRRGTVRPDDPKAYAMLALVLTMTSLFGASVAPTNRSVDWWLGSYTVEYVDENAGFIKAHKSTMTGVLHCCRGVVMEANGSLALSTATSDGALFEELTVFEVAAGLDPVMIPVGQCPKSPIATDNLLENTDGRGRSTPSVFSRGGSLLPSIYADARYIDAVIVSKAPVRQLCSTVLLQKPSHSLCPPHNSEGSAAT